MSFSKYKGTVTVICKTCGVEFLKWKKAKRHGGRRAGVRYANATNCSSKCSKIWTRERCI